MSKIIRTRKPSVLPYYAAALVIVVLCAVLPEYRQRALAAAQAAAALAILVIPLYHTRPEKILNAPAALSGLGCAPGEFVL